MNWNFRMNDLFLRANPEINRMLQNDVRLKEVGVLSELRSMTFKDNQFPILFRREETYYNQNDFSILNYVKFFLCMVLNKQLCTSLEYFDCNCSDRDVQDLMNILQKAFEVAHAKYIEYFSGIAGVGIQMSSKSRGNRVFYIRFDLKLEEMYPNALTDTFVFLNGCVKIKEMLIKQNFVNKRMSEYEIAKVIYNWVVLHTNYDTTFQKYSFSGFSALFYGFAVCQGFTALYNALCKLFGLNIVGMQGEAYSNIMNRTEKHIWSFALLDNRNVYIDVTWGSPKFENEDGLRQYGIDPSLLCDFKFFDIPYNVLRKDHHWDTNLYG